MMSTETRQPYPLPEPTALTRPFWEACQSRELKVAVCGACNHYFMPGAPNCPECWSSELSLQPVSGKGEVFSFVVYRRTYHPAIPAPYAVALIQLEEGPRLVSNIVDCAFDKIEIGMRVEVCFQAEDGFLLPRFRPSANKSTDTN
jgi:uncharacterized OB-fold protein